MQGGISIAGDEVRTGEGKCLERRDIQDLQLMNAYARIFKAISLRKACLKFVLTINVNNKFVRYSGETRIYQQLWIKLLTMGPQKSGSYRPDILKLWGGASRGDTLARCE